MRVWLDFVNTDPVAAGGRSRRRGAPGTARAADPLDDFGAFLDWLCAAGTLDAERAAGILRRAEQQPAGAGAVLADARRVRAAFRALAERGGGGGGGTAAASAAERARSEAVAEVNRVLGRSAGARRIDVRDDGAVVRAFAPVGDAFAGLLIPVADSAADALVLGELARVRRCAGPRCGRVFYDATRNGRRRWCDMATCGNRAKAARHRARGRAQGEGGVAGAASASSR
jgi:predicted RNA-binding Zn ribbon-like protein